MNFQEEVTDSQRRQVRENWLRVQSEVAEACSSAHRSASEVTIVGVTKYVGAGLAAALVDAGCQHLGENRPQMLWDKADALSGRDVQWHLIGHLQRNKVARTVRQVRCIHSLDSLRLAQAIDAEGHRVDCLLEVNISGDQSKHGLMPESLEATLVQINALANVHVCGLMGMASNERRGDQAAIDFRSLRELRDRLSLSTSIALPELSMGMSGDFHIAIGEGATIVRIGSRLFDTGIDPDQNLPSA